MNSTNLKDTKEKNVRFENQHIPKQMKKLAVEEYCKKLLTKNKTKE